MNLKNDDAKTVFEQSLDALTCDDLAPKKKSKKKSSVSDRLSAAFWAILALALFGIAVWSSTEVVINLLDYSSSDENYSAISGAFSPTNARKEKPALLPKNKMTYAIADYDALISGHIDYPTEPDESDTTTEPVSPTEEPTGTTTTPVKPRYYRDLSSSDPQLSHESVLESAERVAAMRKQFENEDVFGWISIPGTGIDYPLVRGSDNDYYLHHSPDKRSTGYGSIYMDYRDSLDLYENDFTLIYGHNIRNDMSMFNRLLDYLKERLFQKNRYFYIYTENAVYKYEVFSCYVADATKSPTSTINYLTPESFLKKINEIKDNSLYQREKAVLYDTDKITMLYTCANSTYSLDRCLVFGVLVEMGK